MTNTPENGHSPQEHTPEVAKALLRVGITPGDTNGVGYELILKTFSEPAMFELCTPIVFGSAKVGSYHRKGLNCETAFNFIDAANNARPGALNMVNCMEEDVPVDYGRVSREAGKAAYVALEAATEALKAGEIDVLVTAPICKEAIQSADFCFAGHTEYLYDRLAVPAETAEEQESEPPLMILTNRLMRIALVTTHLPISQVAAAITQEGILQKIKQFYDSLRSDFLAPAPRIAVLGLNPHCGDGGVLGNEEVTIISPAIKAAIEEGIPCFGPYSTDGFFGAGLYEKFDGILAMYHDQGLAPFKALSMDDGVNVTAGLPFVRTSPDHGTAFDIAGKGTANPESFRQAIYTAIDIYRNRQAHEEAYANPLPKLYRERREDGGRNRHLPNAPKQEEESKE